MKEHSDSFGNILNEVTQTAEKSDEAQISEQIVYIDIDDLESNPKNFYGLRDVDALAGLIAVSHLVEPLTVSKKADGKYRIISGHRRRAAVEKLLTEGVYSERKLPCIIKTLKKIEIEQENGETIEFDEDAVEMLNLSSASVPSPHSAPVNVLGPKWKNRFISICCQATWSGVGHAPNGAGAFGPQETARHNVTINNKLPRRRNATCFPEAVSHM